MYCCYYRLSRLWLRTLRQSEFTAWSRMRWPNVRERLGCAWLWVRRRACTHRSLIYDHELLENGVPNFLRKIGAPGAIPTRDLPLRRRTLYAAELREHKPFTVRNIRQAVKQPAKLIVA